MVVSPKKFGAKEFGNEPQTLSTRKEWTRPLQAVPAFSLISCEKDRLADIRNTIRLSSSFQLCNRKRQIRGRTATRRKDKVSTTPSKAALAGRTNSLKISWERNRSAIQWE